MFREGWYAAVLGAIPPHPLLFDTIEIYAKGIGTAGRRASVNVEPEAKKYEKLSTGLMQP